MPFNQEGFFNCPLTRFLDELIAIEADNGKGQAAATMLSFLGAFHPEQKQPDYRNLRGFMEVLAAEKHGCFYSEIRKPCANCQHKTYCHVGVIILHN